MSQRVAIAARTNLGTLPADIAGHLAALQRLMPTAASDDLDALATFCAIALRVMAKTPHDLIQSETRTFQIGQYLRASLAQADTEPPRLAARMDKPC